MVSERKRITLQGELEEMRSLVENAERARKHAESELTEAHSRISELTIQITTISNDKRRLEGDIGVMQADLDDAINAKQAAEDRANRLNTEVLRLADELRQEQENYKHAESLRKQLEIEIREITFEAEQRRGKEAMAGLRKYERQYKELQTQAEDDRRMVLELQDLLDKTQMKMKAYKRQLEESVSSVNHLIDDTFTYSGHFKCM
ncbi:unnamed protein product [Protopolystoma xenopodis]|uniref:Paramyosin n=1 Tax=Protopolystoma xenopodis TaxID=117903 RepID=A0A448WZQ5_9PLAT|nr:unnamed protein product [Protopolystoma xenopodis]